MADTPYEYGYADIFMWSIILLVLILAGWVALSALRRRMKGEDPTAGAGFTLADLRQLHKSGQMSTEEYEKAKAILLATLAKPPVAKPTSEPKTLPPDRPVP